LVLTQKQQGSGPGADNRRAEEVAAEANSDLYAPEDVTAALAPSAAQVKGWFGGRSVPTLLFALGIAFASLAVSLRENGAQEWPSPVFIGLLGFGAILILAGSIERVAGIISGRTQPVQPARAETLPGSIQEPAVRPDGPAPPQLQQWSAQTQPEVQTQPDETSSAPAKTGRQPNTAAPATVQAMPIGTSIQLALHIGWTMAVLRRPDPQPPPAQGPRLPSVDELDPDSRRELEVGRLSHLLKLDTFLPSDCSAAVAGLLRAVNEEEFQARLLQLNFTMLLGLAAFRPEMTQAYELGRSLRDTANPPSAVVSEPGDLDQAMAAVRLQLSDVRVAQLQSGLAALAAQLPAHAARIVSLSIGRWNALASSLRRLDPEVARSVYDYLLRQGDIWLTLLIGSRPAIGLLTPEGYAAAREAALRRTGGIARRLLRRYWMAALAAAAIAGGLLYLALASLRGMAEVWTSIAVVGGTVGVSLLAVTSAVTRISANAGRYVLGLEAEQAMAWTITTLPPVALTSSGVRQLRSMEPTKDGVGRLTRG
jgi:hypothetical protein